MLPKIKTAIPGPFSRQYMAELAAYESPAITARYLARAESGGIDCPIVFAKVNDVFIYDVDGNRFIDLTAGFGVAITGHANGEIVTAAQGQLAAMPHAMGDAFPAQNKVLLAKKLSEITPGNLKRSLFANAGFEAVEAALKTALLKTGKPGIIAFENAYHGLGYGALAVTSYRKSFREPFLSQLNPHVYHLPYPTVANGFAEKLEQTIQQSVIPIGAIIIEPILGRGGIIEASLKSLQMIREITSHYNIVMIVDEIYTGFGRTGSWFAIEAADVVPDLLCIGKGLSGGFPISAAIGTDDVMSGWKDTPGEAIHTSTFLGNPVGCAMALKSIQVLEAGLLAEVNIIGPYFKDKLFQLQKMFPVIYDIRGRGLMLGIEFKHADKHFTLKLSKKMLQRGLICLPCGLESNVLSFTPSYTLQISHVDFIYDQLQELLKETL
ncbi:MAG: aspartate aminotransferase family protein [Gammaproteobacteria bacterium]|nr:aspartate aminotransferase family protein [Gammaproteobacteria bacterium]